jgi:hypothetical protein
MLIIEIRCHRKVKDIRSRRWQMCEDFLWNKTEPTLTKSQRCKTNEKPLFCTHIWGIYFVINYGLFVSRFISWIEEKRRQEWGLGVRFSPGFPPSLCLKISTIILKGTVSWAWNQGLSSTAIHHSFSPIYPDLNPSPRSRGASIGLAIFFIFQKVRKERAPWSNKPRAFKRVVT